MVQAAIRSCSRKNAASLLKLREKEKQNGNNRRIAIRDNGKGKLSQRHLTLAGHLFNPTDFDDTIVYPALIVHAAVTMVKEQAPDNYARLLVLHDFVVLTFDYASYGESEGLPRNNESVQGKLEDQRR